MSRSFSGVLQALGGKRTSLNFQVFSKNVCQLAQFARGNTTQVACHQQTTTLPTWNRTLLYGQKQNQLKVFKLPEHSNPFSSGMEMFLPAQDFSIVEKHLPSLFPSSFCNRIFENIISSEQEQKILDEGNNNIVYFMGSLLKKRRKKMNRQKYKKRRKRDRFKRAALKNLRERKRQRKERAAARKQSLLSKMVVSKSISKRRARYLSHKLLPGIVKGQSID